MHFYVEAKVRGCGCLCIAMKGSLWRSVLPVRRVRSRSCCNYGPLDCVHQGQCAMCAIRRLTLLATVTLAVADKGPSLVGWQYLYRSEVALERHTCS